MNARIKCKKTIIARDFKLERGYPSYFLESHEFNIFLPLIDFLNDAVATY
jgi:hypothetical protein